MMSDDNFNVQWDETDVCQVEEDSWISDVIGTEDEVINDLVYGK
ncbi:hypothetical protein Syn7803C97_48 [Synechococcus phage S-MbCM6]|jgi:hypothetical protein|uniref:Uncharacterized protein n=3 Tax=Namakavirus smbcm6 TaxID=2734120 RepID=H8ZMF5_9CAUD|nr:hypothetical protein [Synechococcus phage ACG-2014c]AHB80684.1 hypothetical protein S-MbCM25_049 [Synechococcus phage S-MbCM25]AFD02666.1 hypothetical protein [Synechococcus phage ACG-2014c]AIX14443.1 hypothetical protein Syn7803C43_48 [Synechococcus phage ACG-2014c]AIX22601.1 hypothetical protein Syn7803C97_48 [Synechococcus phage ACG-2014c]AIX22816.1 hypothetical protein Syn7803C98_48 [Synechococcus phage ACG-2014c]